MRRCAVGMVGVLLLLMFCQAGCTFIKEGRFVDNSQFVYPNSNVRILGPAQAKKTKWTILLPPKFGIKDLKQVYNEALSSQEGANILVNYTEDTTLIYLAALVLILKYEIRGEAARMVVGEQELE